MRKFRSVTDFIQPEGTITDRPQMAGRSATSWPSLSHRPTPSSVRVVSLVRFVIVPSGWILRMIHAVLQLGPLHSATQPFKILPFHGEKKGVSEMLSSVLEDVGHAVFRNMNGAQLLQELLSAPWLRALLKMYECLLQFQRLTPSPFLPYASGLSHEIMTTIQKVHRPSAEARELYSLLSSPHIQALLSSHDSVAQSDYGPVLPPLPDEMPEDEEAMRIVCLVKNNQPLGATIRRDEETGEIYIARVIHGGLADRSGLLHPGDLLVEVNGKPVVGMEPEQVIQILINSQGTILFKVIPNLSQSSGSQKSVFMKALVDYCPLQDASIPCPNAGIAFSRGDLLEVVDQSDGQWWQARKLPCAASCAGLIPSASMLKSKQREQWWCQPLQVHTCIRP
ncbi:MAGUK p55 subfamily member 4-like [Micropterus dolomieu]|uniref:MAGUK p55 subfamily member 4-like n=1 Tax=Micropterus dolomieu TaxID=147949 RepID=UPI001E8CBE12|nr:MAGUK p55 subfamily member 4-like [Micropterus dolomieu]